jgi:hypothetical protein
MSWKPRSQVWEWWFESGQRGGIGLVFHDLEQLLDSGSNCIGEVHSLMCQGENQRSVLKWGCLAISLLKALFWERGLFQDENLRSMIRSRWCLCYICSLLRYVAFGKAWLLVLSW